MSAVLQAQAPWPSQHHHDSSISHAETQQQHSPQRSPTQSFGNGNMWLDMVPPPLRVPSGSEYEPEFILSQLSAPGSESLESTDNGSTARLLRQSSSQQTEDDSADQEGSDSDSEGGDREPLPGVEIFVGGLTRSTTRDMLREWFSHVGDIVEVRLARDKRRRRCRGYGYVRFASLEQAQRAIDTMQAYQFKRGCFLGVLPSDENRTLYVSGLREHWGKDQVSRFFQSKLEGLKSVQLVWDRDDASKLRPFCFIEFYTHAQAAAAHARYHQPEPPSTLSPPTTIDALSAASSFSDSAADAVAAAMQRRSAAAAAQRSGGGGGYSCGAPTARRPPPPTVLRRGGSGSDGGGSDGEGGALQVEVQVPLSGDGSGATGFVSVVRGPPLALDAVELRVDWADPLRYFIHLYGGVNRHTMQTRARAAPPPASLTPPFATACGGGGRRELPPGALAAAAGAHLRCAPPQPRAQTHLQPLRCQPLAASLVAAAGAHHRMAAAGAPPPPPQRCAPRPAHHHQPGMDAALRCSGGGSDSARALWAHAQQQAAVQFSLDVEREAAARVVLRSAAAGSSAALPPPGSPPWRAAANAEAALYAPTSSYDSSYESMPSLSPGETSGTAAFGRSAAAAAAAGSAARLMADFASGGGGASHELSQAAGALQAAAAQQQQQQRAEHDARVERHLRHLQRAALSMWGPGSSGSGAYGGSSDSDARHAGSGTYSDFGDSAAAASASQSWAPPLRLPPGLPSNRHGDGSSGGAGMRMRSNSAGYGGDGGGADMGGSSHHHQHLRSASDRGFGRALPQQQLQQPSPPQQRTLQMGGFATAVPASAGRSTSPPHQQQQQRLRSSPPGSYNIDTFALHMGGGGGGASSERWPSPFAMLSLGSHGGGGGGGGGDDLRQPALRTVFVERGASDTDWRQQTPPRHQRQHYSHYPHHAHAAAPAVQVRPDA